MARKPIHQVAAIPLRIRDERLEALLITSSRGDWIVPKGHIDPGHTPSQMAAIESYEEAGVVGEPIDPPLGAFTYSRRSTEYRVTTYALHAERVLSSWKESHRRSRIWLPVADAAQTVVFHGLQQILMELAKCRTGMTDLGDLGGMVAVRRSA